METSEITCNQGRTPQENKNFVTKEIENSALKKDLGGQGIQRGQKVVPNQHHEINRKKIVGGKYGKILMVKYKSSQSLSSQMAFSVLFSSHDDLGLSSHIGCFYGQMVAEDPPQNCHDFPCWKHFNLSIKGIMNHVDSSIWQLLHSSAIGKHD